jgi:hypothetical protein
LRVERHFPALQSAPQVHEREGAVIDVALQRIDRHLKLLGRFFRRQQRWRIDQFILQLFWISARAVK